MRLDLDESSPVRRRRLPLFLWARVPFDPTAASVGTFESGLQRRPPNAFGNLASRTIAKVEPVLRRACRQAGRRTSTSPTRPRAGGVRRRDDGSRGACRKRHCAALATKGARTIRGRRPVASSRRTRTAERERETTRLAVAGRRSVCTRPHDGRRGAVDAAGARAAPRRAHRRRRDGARGWRVTRAAPLFRRRDAPPRPELRDAGEGDAQGGVGDRDGPLSRSPPCVTVGSEQSRSSGCSARTRGSQVASTPGEPALKSARGEDRRVRPPVRRPQQPAHVAETVPRREEPVAALPEEHVGVRGGERREAGDRGAQAVEDRERIARRAVQRRLGLDQACLDSRGDGDVRRAIRVLLLRTARRGVEPLRALSVVGTRGSASARRRSVSPDRRRPIGG